MKSKIGSLFIAGGLLLIAAALSVACYNIWENRRAGESVAAAVSQLEERIPVAETVPQWPPASEVTGEIEIPDHILNPDMDMPTEHIDGWDYIGMLEVPAVDLTLPVISAWSYPALKIAPCRYAGSAYKDGMVIAAHNYPSHFSRLQEMREGDRIIFTDVDGNMFRYDVVLCETLAPTDIEEMTSGEWALSLFTCTYDGRYRFTVRCEQADSTE